MIYLTRASVSNFDAFSVEEALKILGATVSVLLFYVVRQYSVVSRFHANILVRFLSCYTLYGTMIVAC